MRTPCSVSVLVVPLEGRTGGGRKAVAAACGRSAEHSQGCSRASAQRVACCRVGQASPSCNLLLALLLPLPLAEVPSFAAQILCTALQLQHLPLAAHPARRLILIGTLRPPQPTFQADCILLVCVDPFPPLLTAATAMDRVEDVAEQLAEALAAAWNCSRASAAACAAMHRLLPGLQYLRWA